VIEEGFHRLMEWADENEPDDDDAVRFAAHFHHEFMRIFPFTKHTGKTGRLLVNHVLIRHGYMPVIFHATERHRYYDTLRLGRKDMEALLIDMMTNCIENGVRYIRHQLEARAKKAGARRATAV
jgi:Fic family protein